MFGSRPTWSWRFMMQAYQESDKHETLCGLKSVIKSRQCASVTTWHTMVSDQNITKEKSVTLRVTHRTPNRPDGWWRVKFKKWCLILQIYCPGAAFRSCRENGRREAPVLFSSGVVVKAFFFLWVLRTGPSFFWLHEFRSPRVQKDLDFNWEEKYIPLKWI